MCTDYLQTEITQENAEEVTQMTSDVAEAISDVEEEQTTENLEVVINVIIGTTNITDSDTTITEQVSIESYLLLVLLKPKKCNTLA